MEKLGAQILFVPSNTNDRHGHLRVRICCQARAIENQVYVVNAGCVGNLPLVENADTHYAQSGIFTPSDIAFARDGVAVRRSRTSRRSSSRTWTSSSCGARVAPARRRTGTTGGSTSTAWSGRRESSSRDVLHRRAMPVEDAPDLGRYRILEHLHDGEVADIYLGRQWGDGGFFRPVAIKRLHDRHVDDGYALIHFQDEAMLLAALSHRAFPEVFDLRVVGRSWFIAMQYVRGRRLDTVTAAGQLPHGVALSVATQICDGLSHAHELRAIDGTPTPIVHCKVTPQNVVLTPDGIVSLLDLGAARSPLRRHERSEIHETTAYLAPEQILGETVDARTDVFALGALLYELTTGRAPFEGDDLEVTTAIVEKDAPPPSSVSPGYPDALEAIVLRALARDPSARYATAAQLSRALDSFALQDGILVGPKVIATHVRSALGDRPPHPRLLDEPVPPAMVIGESVSPDEVELVDE